MAVTITVNAFKRCQQFTINFTTLSLPFSAGTPSPLPSCGLCVHLFLLLGLNPPALCFSWCVTLSISTHLGVRLKRINAWIASLMLLHPANVFAVWRERNNLMEVNGQVRGKERERIVGGHCSHHCECVWFYFYVISCYIIGMFCCSKITEHIPDLYVYL